MTATADVTGIPEVSPSPPPVGVDSQLSVPLAAFLVFAMLVLAVWVLLRSFTSRLRKIDVPEDEVVVVREEQRRTDVPPGAPPA